MLLYGASGHCKVVIDCLESNNIPISGIFDDDLSLSKILNYNVIGRYSEKTFPNEKLIISIGDNKTRKAILKNIKHRFGKVAHTSTIISSNVKIGIGTVVFHHAVIQSSAIIGKHVIINTNASVDHGCIVKNFAHISPNATLCGNVKIGEGTHIGAGAVVIPNITIGKWCVIGAGSVIIKDIPDFSVVVGNPGKIIKRTNIVE